MLVGISYFTGGPRRIFNASVAEEPSRDSLSVNDAINGYIKYCQPIFLKSVIGAELSIQVSERLKQVEEVGDKTGLDILIDKLREPFADFVFFTIVKNANEQSTITGLVHLKSVNDYIAPISTLVRTWNAMADKLQDFIYWAASEECPYKVKIEKHMITPINSLNL